MSNQLTRFNRVRYTLYSDLFAPSVIPEPEGWDNDQKELLRSQKYHGISRNFTSSLRFYGRGFQLLKSAYDLQKIMANVRIEREERNENTDVWELVYDATFDFSTYQQEKNYISIKLNESQFFKRIESKIKEKIELDRDTDLKGNPIPPMIYEEITFEGRDIFRESALQNTQDLFFTTGDDNTQNEFWSVVPSQLKYKSDEKFFVPSLSILSTGYVNVTGRKLDYTGTTPDIAVLRPNSGQVFFLNADETTTMNITVKIRVIAIRQGVSFPMLFVLSRHQISETVNTQINFLDMQVISEFMVIGGQPTLHEFEWNGDVTIPERGCLCLSSRNSGITTQHNVRYEVSELIVRRTQLAKTTKCKGVSMFNAFDRILHIINGKRCFDSDLLSNGFWRDLFLSNGFFIRKIPDKNITISLEELWEAMTTIDDVAMFITNQRVRLEPRNTAYILDPSQALDIGEVVDIKREIKADYFYSSIEIGYDFNGEYEEVMGLDEPNIKTLYQTPIDVQDEKYQSISKLRADSYGMTLAQLKPFENFPKEDTKYDKVNFLFDCIRTLNTIRLRVWQDDFENEPTGIFSPQTAKNLRLSPFNCLLRKGRFLNAALVNYPNGLITYASTEGNSQLVTLFPERANVPISVLPAPYLLAETITFNKKTSMALFRELNQKIYNLIKFVNEFGTEEYVFANSVKPNKEGQYSGIKANI